MTEPTPDLRSDFLEWLRTGSFRGVRLGMTRGECVEKLGEPEEWLLGETQATAGMWFWAGLHFSFSTEELVELFGGSPDILIGISSDREASFLALFGYGSDEAKEISVTELNGVLYQAEVKFRTFLLHEPSDSSERTILKVAPHGFHFRLTGPAWRERLRYISQDLSKGGSSLKEIP